MNVYDAYSQVCLLANDHTPHGRAFKSIVNMDAHARTLFLEERARKYADLGEWIEDMYITGRA